MCYKHYQRLLLYGDVNTVNKGSGNLRHGMAKSRIWGIYISMRQRTGKHGGKNKKWYANISCEWKTFEDFYKDMGESYEKHVLEYGEKQTSIDRIDSKGNYCKDNCRWATKGEQVRNSSQTRWFTYNGKTQCMKDWAREYGIKYGTLKARIDISGWPIGKALTKSVL